MAKEREAEQWEKDWIRLEFERLVSAKATALVIDTFRREVADLLGLSYQQVKAIGAWKKKPDQDKLVLEPTRTAEMTTNRSDASSSNHG